MTMDLSGNWKNNEGTTVEISKNHEIGGQPIFTMTPKEATSWGAAVGDWSPSIGPNIGTLTFTYNNGEKKLYGLVVAEDGTSFQQEDLHKTVVDKYVKTS